MGGLCALKSPTLSFRNTIRSTSSATEVRVTVSTRHTSKCRPTLRVLNGSLRPECSVTKKSSGKNPQTTQSLLAGGILATGPLLPGVSLAQPSEITELAVGLDMGIQLLYLGALLALLFTGAALVVRQVLVKRELESTAKNVGERVRSGSATGEDFFELGVLLLRKKSYTQAIKNLESAIKVWDGEPEELAQAYNALGFAQFNQEKAQAAVESYRKAVELQPGYVTAWNNLGNAYEKQRKNEEALECYEETLTYDAENEVAKQRAQMLSTRLGRLKSY